MVLEFDKLSFNNNLIKIPLANGNNGYIVYSKNQKIDEEKWFNNKQLRLQSQIGEKYNSTWADIKNIEDYAMRLYYYIELKADKIDNPKHLTVFMINPAFAYSVKDDRTINIIKKNVKKDHEDIVSLSIINISPIRTPYIESLLRLEEKENLYNRQEYTEFLKTKLKNSDYILLAWGNTIDELKFPEKTISLSTILMEKEISKKIRILGRTQDGNPMHPLARRKKDWSFSNEVTILENLKIKK